MTLSTNQKTLGVTTADVLRFFNPSYDPNGIIIGAGDTGATGTGGDKTWTVSGAAWNINQWEGWFLLVAGAFYKIASNSATVLTLASGDLSAATGAWAITHQRVTMTQDVFDFIVERAAGAVKSALPEKYRRMITRIEGHIIVPQAGSGQTAAAFAFALDSATDGLLWKNLTLDYSQRTVALAMSSSDWTLDPSGKKAITFSAALSTDDQVIADYMHTLDTVPRVLNYLAALKTAMSIYKQFYLGHPDLTPVYEEWSATYNQMIEALNRAENPMGIDEFDDLLLVNETRTDVGSYLYGEVEGRR